MASPLALRTPTCLSCLRRITQPARPAILTQLRGKKTKSKLVVQINDDLPGWGPKGNIIRVPRELMRNKFYPSGQMRYITPDEWRTAKYGENDIAVRNRSYMMRKGRDATDQDDDAYDPLAEDMARLELTRHPVEVGQIDPERALHLLTEFVPETIYFERRLVHAEGAYATTPEQPQQQPQTSSGLAARRAQEEKEQSRDGDDAATATQAAPEEEQQPPQEQEHQEDSAAATEAVGPEAMQLQLLQSQQQEQQEQEQQADLRRVHGSVSAFDIARTIRELMFLDPEAARIQISAEDIAFVCRHDDGTESVDDHTAKIERTGTFEVLVTPQVGKTKLDPIRRTIEVLPTMDDEAAAAADSSSLDE